MPENTIFGRSSVENVEPFITEEDARVIEVKAIEATELRLGSLGVSEGQIKFVTELSNQWLTLREDCIS